MIRYTTLEVHKLVFDLFVSGCPTYSYFVRKNDTRKEKGQLLEGACHRRRHDAGDSLSGSSKLIHVEPGT